MKTYIASFSGELNDLEELRQREKTGRAVLWVVVPIIWAFTLFLHYFTGQIPELWPVHLIALLFAVKLLAQGKLAAVSTPRWIPFMGFTILDILLTDLFIAITGGFSSPFILLPAIYVLSFVVLHGLIQGLFALVFSVVGLIALYILANVMFAILPEATFGSLVIVIFGPFLSGGMGFFFCWSQKLKELKQKERIQTLNSFITQPSCKPDVLAKLKTHLTEREFEVAGLVLEGLSNTEIAQRLSISENTVKVNLQNIFKKLGIHSRMELLQQFICSRSTLTMDASPQNQTD